MHNARYTIRCLLHSQHQLLDITGFKIFYHAITITESIVFMCAVISTLAVISLWVKRSLSTILMGIHSCFEQLEVDF